MCIEAKDGSTIGCLITSDAFKNTCTVVHCVGQDVNLGILPGNEFTVFPNRLGGFDSQWETLFRLMPLTKKRDAGENGRRGVS